MANIIDTVIHTGVLNTLTTALEATHLADTLRANCPFTVFAPTDGAFAQLPVGTVDELFKDVPRLKKILTYHIVVGQVRSTDVTDLKSVKTYEGSDIVIDASSEFRVNSCKVITSDVRAENGVIHIIDTMLTPETPSAIF
ncbi:MAG: fasciclin domain-containing protein [Oscillatoriophycideae cyanobacterium NC_groundwater_1537_Pr4_S-0.65um_50_18]|nr:fasciclin domain-containing protein [Oscillatoriophycideae cyanobacterium NC_groundwater_1537_Pr4_S-0.65um_50_18]